MPNHPYPPPPAANKDNNLNIAGFVVSLVGLLACGGILSPVGLILSYIAMKRQSDGLAVAGFVLGLIGSLWLIIALAFGLFGILLAALGIAAGANAP